MSRHPAPPVAELDAYEARWPAIQGGTSEALVREAAKRRDTQLGQVARVALHLFDQMLTARREAKQLRATLDATNRRVDALLVTQLEDTNRIRALLDDRMRAHARGPQWVSVPYGGTWLPALVLRHEDGAVRVRLFTHSPEGAWQPEEASVRSDVVRGPHYWRTHEGGTW